MSLLLQGDCGYSSGHECENYSVPSSHNGSDVACSEGICNHDGDSLLCQRVELEDVCGDCDSSSPNLSPKNGSPKVGLYKYRCIPNGTSLDLYVKGSFKPTA